MPPFTQPLPPCTQPTPDTPSPSTRSTGSAPAAPSTSSAPGSEQVATSGVLACCVVPPLFGGTRAHPNSSRHPLVQGTLARRHLGLRRRTGRLFRVRGVLVAIRTSRHPRPGGSRQGSVSAGRGWRKSAAALRWQMSAITSADRWPIISSRASWQPATCYRRAGSRSPSSGDSGSAPPPRRCWTDR